MSRAVLMIALYESLGRLPTPEEKERFLVAMAREVGGERIYIAHRQLSDAEARDEIRRLREQKWSIRRIAGAVGKSKSYVALVVSTISPYEVDKATA
jgi:hypothetical protein